MLYLDKHVSGDPHDGGDPFASLSTAKRTSVTEGPSYNWTSRSVVAREIAADSYGVVCARDIQAGEIIAVHGGVVVDRANVERVPEELRRYFYQIAPKIWYGPGTKSTCIGTGDYFNHSCSPNAGFVDPVTMVAIRDIHQGEEVTVDYAQFQSDDLEGSSFTCSCGNSACRNSVDVDDWRRIGATDPMLDFMQPYIQALINPHPSPLARRFAELHFPEEWHLKKLTDGMDACLISTAINDESWNIRATRTIKQNEVVGILGGRAFREGEVPAEQKVVRSLRAGFVIGPTPRNPGEALYTLPRGKEGNITTELGLFLVSAETINPGTMLKIRTNPNVTRGS